MPIKDYKFTYIVVYQYFTGPDASIGNIDYHSNDQISTTELFARMQDIVRKSVGRSDLIVTNVMRLPL